jgi:ATP-dependent helicase HrpA
LGAQARDLAKRLAQDSQLLLAASPYARAADLTDAILQQTFARALRCAQTPRTPEEFERLLQQGRAELHAGFEAVCAQIKALLAEAIAVRRLLQESGSRGDPAILEEAHTHIAALLQPARWRDLETDQLRHFTRYLKAAATRWRRVATRPGDASANFAELQRWRVESARISASYQGQGHWTPELDEFGWLIEEYRCALSAQELKTAVPVSAARLQQRLSQLQAWLNR